jgi:hypothetical protein
VVSRGAGHSRSHREGEVQVNSQDAGGGGGGDGGRGRTLGLTGYSCVAVVNAMTKSKSNVEEGRVCLAESSMPPWCTHHWGKPGM